MDYLLRYENPPDDKLRSPWEMEYYNQGPCTNLGINIGFLYFLGTQYNGRLACSKSVPHFLKERLVLTVPL